MAIKKIVGRGISKKREVKNKIIKAAKKALKTIEPSSVKAIRKIAKEVKTKGSPKPQLVISRATGLIPPKKLKPFTKKKLKKIKVKRPKGPHSPTAWGTKDIGAQNLARGCK